MKEFQVLIQAIDKAFTQGVYNLQEASSILGAARTVEGALIEAQKPEAGELKKVD